LMTPQDGRPPPPFWAGSFAKAFPVPFHVALFFPICFLLSPRGSPYPFGSPPPPNAAPQTSPCGEFPFSLLFFACEHRTFFRKRPLHHIHSFPPGCRTPFFFSSPSLGFFFNHIMASGSSPLSYLPLFPPSTVTSPL